MVTRTITTSAINAKVFNPETEEIEEKVFERPNKLSIEDAEKILSKEGIKVLKIKEISYVTNLTGMTDEEWMEHSHILPPRGKKADA